MSDNQVEINREYLKWLQCRYPIRFFSIGNFRFTSVFEPFLPEDDGKRTFYLLDEKDEEIIKREKDKLLNGEELTEEDRLPAIRRSLFIINTKKKIFNYSLAEKDRRKGLGTLIYYQAPQIMQAMGIKDAEEYTIKVAGNENHPFLKRLKTKELVARAISEPNLEKAKNLLGQLSQYPEPIKLAEYTTIISYAIRSNVPMNEIADAINANGFNVKYRISQMVPVFDKEEAEAFKSLKIQGIKPSCLRKHFDGMKGYGVLSLFESADIADSTQELTSLIEYYEKNKSPIPEGFICYSKLRGLSYIILYIDKSGFLFRNVDPKSRETVRKTALALFERTDPEHKEEWSYNRADQMSNKIFAMLKDAKLLDAKTYIALYQRALNRNYSLEAFQRVMSYYVDDDTKANALHEIEQNTYCPSPKKGIWQKSKSYDPCCRPQVVLIPNNLIKGMDNKTFKESLVDTIKRRIDPKEKSIKTTMRFRKGKRLIEVSDLVGWMRGVDGWKGYLGINSIEGKKYVVFPPQTQKKVLDVVSEAFKIMEDPDYGTRI